MNAASIIELARKKVDDEDDGFWDHIKAKATFVSIDGPRIIPAGPAKTIFEYAGLDSWATIAGVCRSWRHNIMAIIFTWRQRRIGGTPTPNMFRRSMIALHSVSPTIAEISSMLFGGDWAWEIIWRRWLSLAGFAAALRRVDASISRVQPDNYAHAYEQLLPNIKATLHRAMHYPPAALPLLECIIEDINSAKSQRFYVGCAINRYLFNVDHTLHNYVGSISKLMNLVQIGWLPHRDQTITIDFNDAVGVYRELIVVSMSLFCDSIKWPTGESAKYFADYISATPITLPHSRAAVERMRLRLELDRTRPRSASATAVASGHVGFADSHGA